MAQPSAPHLGVDAPSGTSEHRASTDAAEARATTGVHGAVTSEAITAWPVALMAGLALVILVLLLPPVSVMHRGFARSAASAAAHRTTADPPALEVSAGVPGPASDQAPYFLPVPRLPSATAAARVEPPPSTPEVPRDAQPPVEAPPASLPPGPVATAAQSVAARAPVQTATAVVRAQALSNVVPTVRPVTTTAQGTAASAAPPAPAPAAAAPAGAPAAATPVTTPVAAATPRPTSTPLATPPPPTSTPAPPPAATATATSAPPTPAPTTSTPRRSVEQPATPSSAPSSVASPASGGQRGP